MCLYLTFLYPVKIIKSKNDNIGTKKYKQNCGKLLNNGAADLFIISSNGVLNKQKLNPAIIADTLTAKWEMEKNLDGLTTVKEKYWTIKKIIIVNKTITTRILLHIEKNNKKLNQNSGLQSNAASITA